MRPIDADKIVYYESIDADTLAGTGKFYVPRELIDAMPTIEQRKTGKWIVHKSGWVCSECNEFVVSAIMGYPRYNFCPMCGAKMEGAGSEDIPMEYFENGGR